MTSFVKDPIEKYREEFHSLFRLDKNIEFTTEEKDIGNVARIAALKAGQFMRDGLGAVDEEDIVSKIGSRDIVTKVDKECQDAIKETILHYFPQHKFLGEEDVPPGNEASAQAIEKLKNEPHLWIVDPVDGTTNYAHGIPIAAVLIAYASYGVVKHGYIYEPFRDESFTAWLGKGAYLNGKVLRRREPSPLNQAVLCTGSPPNFTSLAACLRVTNALSAKARSFRILGSAGVALAWVAAGRVNGFSEPDLNAWDAAAGCLIIQEAGGMVTDVWGQPFQLTTRNIVATQGLDHASFLQELTAVRAWME